LVRPPKIFVRTPIILCAPVLLSFGSVPVCSVRALYLLPFRPHPFALWLFFCFFSATFRCGTLTHFGPFFLPLPIGFRPVFFGPPHDRTRFLQIVSAPPLSFNPPPIFCLFVLSTPAWSSVYVVLCHTHLRPNPFSPSFPFLRFLSFCLHIPAQRDRFAGTRGRLFRKIFGSLVIAPTPPDVQRNHDQRPLIAPLRPFIRRVF